MLSTLLPDGRRQMVGLLLPSDFLGRPGRPTIDYDVVAATASPSACSGRPSSSACCVVNPHSSAACSR